jgi:uncharacterized damage-inducible protein DinB
MSMLAKSHFEQFSRYNRWANTFLLAASSRLTDEERKRPIGLFFGSVHGTLNHLLVTDRIWLGRVTGIDPENGPLDKIMHDDFLELTRARIALDARLHRFVESCAEHSFESEVVYRNTSGQEFRQRLADILSHLFNHQTHHRSQASTGLTLLHKDAPPLDMLYMFRGLPSPSDEQLLMMAEAGAA